MRPPASLLFIAKNTSPGPNLDWVNELLLQESEESFFGSKDDESFAFEVLESSEPEKGGMLDPDQGALKIQAQRYEFSDPAQVDILKNELAIQLSK